MITGNEPINAVLESWRDENPEILVCNDKGLTIRQHIAINAPGNIPEFFNHIPPPKNIDKIDWSVLNDSDQLLCNNWNRDPCYDLPEHLYWVQEKTNKIWDQKTEWEILNNKERYFQWRTFYADNLINELNKPTDK